MDAQAAAVKIRRVLWGLECGTLPGISDAELERRLIELLRSALVDLTPDPKLGAVS